MPCSCPQTHLPRVTEEEGDRAEQTALLCLGARSPDSGLPFLFWALGSCFTCNLRRSFPTHLLLVVVVGSRGSCGGGALKTVICAITAGKSEPPPPTQPWAAKLGGGVGCRYVGGEREPQFAPVAQRPFPPTGHHQLSTWVSSSVAGTFQCFGPSTRPYPTPLAWWPAWWAPLAEPFTLSLPYFPPGAQGSIHK